MTAGSPNSSWRFRSGVTSGRVSFIPRWKRHKAIFDAAAGHLGPDRGNTLATTGLGASFEPRRLQPSQADWRKGNEELCQSHRDRKIERQQGVYTPMAM